MPLPRESVQVLSAWVIKAMNSQERGRGRVGTSCPSVQEKWRFLLLASRSERVP